MKKQNLILIGLSGSGKSTLGHARAKHLGWKFVDTDHTIEELSQTTIPELFLQGEPYFRNWEFEAISSLENLTHTIISTGGGASMELMAGKKLPGVESLLDAYGLGVVH